MAANSHAITINACLAVAVVVFFRIVLRLDVVDRSAFSVALDRGWKILFAKPKNKVVTELSQRA